MQSKHRLSMGNYPGTKRFRPACSKGLPAPETCPPKSEPHKRAARTPPNSSWTPPFAPRLKDVRHLVVIEHNSSNMVGVVDPESLVFDQLAADAGLGGPFLGQSLFDGFLGSRLLDGLLFGFLTGFRHGWFDSPTA